jgi:hypothetical protein
MQIKKFHQSSFLSVGDFLRRREVNKRRLRFRVGELCRSEGRLRLLCLRSDRLVCIRRIATPPSSVAKSNPRCTERIPVDMSVRLAQRGSCVLRKSNDKLSTLEQAIDDRDMCEDGRGLEDPYGLERIDSFRSVVMSRSGCVFRM